MEATKLENCLKTEMLMKLFRGLCNDHYFKLSCELWHGNEFEVIYEYLSCRKISARVQRLPKHQGPL